MADTLEIPVNYKNRELVFKANVVRFGYVHRIMINIEGDQVTIERDEEGKYRALIYSDNPVDNKVDKGLVEAVVTVLQAL